MKKLLLSVLAILAAGTFMFGQSEILINDFTGTLDPSKIYGDNYDASGAPNQSLISFENDMLKADYVWNKPDWYPRAVWYGFDDYIDMTNTPVLEVKFMIEDNDNDSIHVRLDLYGDGLGELNGEVPDSMETNGNPWEVWAMNGQWYTIGSDFTADDRFYCTYFGGGIDPFRIDSSRINGFEAFANYGDNNTANQAGTLWIDYIMVRSFPTGTEQYIVGGNNSFAVAIYPTPAQDNITINSENMVNNVELFDMTGKMVRSFSDIGKQKFELNISDLPRGMYITTVHDTEGQIYSSKLVKQ